MAELTGLTAVITGASSGIGRAIALELGSAGAFLMVHGHRNIEGVAQTANDAALRGAPAAMIHLGNLAEPASQERLVEEAWNWRGGVDIWINNAGVDVLTGPAADWSFEEKLHRLWQVDVLATIRLSRLVGARMKEHRKRSARGGPAAPPLPSLVNIGWDQAETGMAGESGEMFAAVKGAVMSFTRSLARSLAPHVRVNCVAPGWIQTAWGRAASAAWDKRARSESLLGRWGKPEDVARAVRFLVGPESGFVNGQVLCVNGGFRPST